MRHSAGVISRHRVTSGLHLASMMRIDAICHIDFIRQFKRVTRYGLQGVVLPVNPSRCVFRSPYRSSTRQFTRQKASASRQVSSCPHITTVRPQTL